MRSNERDRHLRLTTSRWKLTPTREGRKMEVEDQYRYEIDRVNMHIVGFDPLDKHLLHYAPRVHSLYPSPARFTLVEMRQRHWRRQ